MRFRRKPVGTFPQQPKVLPSYFLKSVKIFSAGCAVVAFNASLYYKLKPAYETLPAIITAFRLPCFCQAAEVSYKLSEAIQKKLVSVKFTGAKDDTAHMMQSSHYGPCISMEIASASAG